MNHFVRANSQVRNGVWLREENRGYELDGLVVGIIGYGNTGKSFARKLKGFNCTVFCYDILVNVGDENATQVSLQTLQEMAQVLSLHVPLTDLTRYMVNADFIDAFRNPFWFLNTARGKCVRTDHLVDGLRSGKVLGAGLDVLEYEKSSFESLFSEGKMPEAMNALIQMDNVLLTPHIGGWTVESKKKLAEVLVEKIMNEFGH
jgi:D-3-phosphoglycerate dehydrogenase